MWNEDNLKQQYGWTPESGDYHPNSTIRELQGKQFDFSTIFKISITFAGLCGILWIIIR